MKFLTSENNMRMSMFIANVHRLHQIENYTKEKSYSMEYLHHSLLTDTIT